MPELPEVEEAVRRLRHGVIGGTIIRVRVLHASQRRSLPPRAQKSLLGARVVDVLRRGKHQMIHLADGRTLHAHFRMSGDWVIDRDPDALPRFARVAIDFDNGTRLVLDDPRALGTISIVPSGESPVANLGPEPSDSALTHHTLGAALATRRISIKAALLDQRIIAGLGNIYVAEALWRARLDPRLPARDLSVAQRRTLLASIRAVLARASGARYSNGGGPRLSVYDREGLACRRCKSEIARFTQSGRSTYWCPKCQSAKRATTRSGERP
jgi:formamidopyrimidine-DNA glycosylase